MNGYGRPIGRTGNQEGSRGAVPWLPRCSLQALGAQPETVRRWLRAGVLRGFQPGGKRLGYRVRESELRRFIAEREGNAAA